METSIITGNTMVDIAIMSSLKSAIYFTKVGSSGMDSVPPKSNTEWFFQKNSLVQYHKMLSLIK